MYLVQYIKDNEWILYSKHKNYEWADANYETLVESGRTVRIIHQGKVIQQGGLNESTV